MRPHPVSGRWAPAVPGEGRGRPVLRPGVVAAGILLCASVLIGCTRTVDAPMPWVTAPSPFAEDGAPSGALPLVGEIAAAVTALEAVLGGPQDYVEINADRVMVSLIVFDTGQATATAYRYRDGELAQASDPFPIGGGMALRAEWMEFDPAQVLARVRTELPDSSVIGFVILAAGEGVARYEAVVRSSQGGLFAVGLGPTGQILGVETL